VIVDEGDIVFAVHSLVENHRQSLLGGIETAEYAEHLVDDPVEYLGIMLVAGVLPVEQGKTGGPVDQQCQAYLLEMMLSCLVVAALENSYR